MGMPDNETSTFVVPHKHCNKMGGGSSQWALQGKKLTHNSYIEKDDCSGSSHDDDGQMEITATCTHWPALGRWVMITDAAPRSVGSAVFALVVSMGAALQAW